MYKLYKPEYNPNSLTGTVGGNIGSQLLSGYLGELFYHISTPPSGVNETTYQYRKVFIRNTYSRSSTYTRVWIDAVEHEDQISVAKSSALSDTSSSPTGSPAGVSGWVSPSSFAEGLSLGTIPPNTYTGIWIRQALSGVSTPDPYATFRLYVGGVI
jgi:hypothetical protein